MSEEITQWEYKALHPNPLQGLNLNDVNKLGSEGWELTATKIAAGGTTDYIFKRPKPKQKQPSYDGYSR